MRRTRSVPPLIVLLVLATVIVPAIVSPPKAYARARVSAKTSPIADLQSGCPAIFPAEPVAVAPNQPGVPDQSTVGIINALCDVTLDFIGCGFLPTSVTLGCDSNGDGVSDLSIPLKNITVINGLFFQATIPALAATPGTAFPLACCGGVTTITLSRTVGAGDDNAFGSFTQTITCPIDLGIRAPVVISATPLEIDCAQGQNILIPGSCFLLAGGKPNVTSVFAVDAGETPSDSATRIILPPKAIPTLGKHERMPATIAITKPILKVFAFAAIDLLPLRFFRDPPTEHSTIPKITSVVPASSIMPLVANNIPGKKTKRGINAPRLAISPMMMG